MALDDSIPILKHFGEHIYFLFKLGQPALLGSKKIAYEYARISRYPWHMKNGIKTFHKKHPGYIFILKRYMIPCVCGKKIIASRCFDVISVLTRDMIIF